MGAVYCLVACLLLYVEQGIGQSVSTSTPDENGVFTLTLQMPNVVSHKDDLLMCTAAKLEPEETYITQFTPHPKEGMAHHLGVVGCTSLANYNESWICDGPHDSITPTSVCGSQDLLYIYPWSPGAPGTTFPQGVGMRVSGSTGINYLVLQMHYGDVFPAGVTDNSGITFSMTKTRLDKQVGNIILLSYGFIPPQRPVVLLDSVCQINLTFTVYPIGYITHSHGLGVVISGYRVRNGGWTNIGRMSPRSPQALYPVNNPGMDIQNGDILTSRCIMNSMTRNTTTVTGPTHNDEMHNFIITYSTRNPANLKTIYCYTSNPKYTWLNTFKAEEIPPESATIEGFPEAEKIKKMFIWP